METLTHMNVINYTYTPYAFSGLAAVEFKDAVDHCKLHIHSLIFRFLNANFRVIHSWKSCYIFLVFEIEFGTRTHAIIVNRISPHNTFFDVKF